MNVVVKDMPEMRVAAVRHVGPYNQIAQAFERLGAIAGPAGILQGPPTMIAIYHDDPESVPQDQLRSDAGVVVPDGVQLPDGLGEQRILAGRYARTTHIGPYEQLGDVWARFLGEWLPANGHRVSPGVSFEIYVNNPTTAPKNELRTDLYIPIA